MFSKLEKLQIWARIFAHLAIRLSFLDELHSGIFPKSKKGDYSDVYVVTPYGNIPWTELNRVSEDEMRVLMTDIEEGLTKTLHLYEKERRNTNFLKNAQETLFNSMGVSWDIPGGDPLKPKKK